MPAWYGKMPHRTEGSGVQPSEIPLAGRLALSATALLLLVLAYRYLKSRAPPGNTPTGAAGANVAGAEPREWQVCSRVENKPAALRHRGGWSRETEPWHPGTNQLTQVGSRGGVAQERGQARIPAGRGETEAEEEQEAREVSHPESGVERGWRSEDEAGEAYCAIQSSVSKTGASLGGRSGAAVGQLHQEREPSNTSSQTVDPVEADSSCAQPVEKDVHPADGVKRGGHQQLGKDPPVAERWFGPENIQSFYATSDMDLAINHNHVAYAFSSVAKVEVEENFIQEKRRSGKAGDTQLRGKVYDYYVQSTSQSVTNETTFGTNLDRQQSCNLSTVNILNVSHKYGVEEPACSSVTKDDDNKLLDVSKKCGVEEPVRSLVTKDDVNKLLDVSKKCGVEEPARSLVTKDDVNKLLDVAKKCGVEEPARSLVTKVDVNKLLDVAKKCGAEEPVHSSATKDDIKKLLNVSKKCGVEEPVHSSATKDDVKKLLDVAKKCGAGESARSSAIKEEANKLVLEKVPDTSSHVLHSPTKDTQPKDQREAVIVEEGNISSKRLLARYSFIRKDSFRKIVDNPELQMPMEGFGSPAIGASAGHTTPPAPLCLDSTSSLVRSMQNLPSSGREEPSVELVAGAKFFHVPLSSDSSLDVHLDLGNCYQVLCMAKKQKLKDLQEAVYKVMSDNYLQVLKTQAIYRQLNAAERDLILEKRMRGKKYLTVADVGCHTSGLSYYDDQKDTWHPLTHIPVEAISRGCAICSMFNYLFVVAGCEGRGRYQKPSNRVFCYNPLTDIWQEVCPLNQARPHCKLVALDGCLYAIGGECLYTVERYDPRLDRWTFAAPLPNDTFAVAHTATVCDGEICVTGGTLRYMLLRYVGRTDTWKVRLTGGSQDRTTEMVTVNGFIYRFDLNQRMGISVYRCSARAKLWYECATHPMPFPSCFQCAVVGNLVYCVSRQFNLRFLADLVSPRFGNKELKNFPSPRGTLIPVTLVLPEACKASQTRV